MASTSQQLDILPERPTSRTRERKRRNGETVADRDTRNRWYFSFTDKKELFVYKFGKAKEAKAFKLDGETETRKVVNVQPSVTKSELVKVIRTCFDTLERITLASRSSLSQACSCVEAKYIFIQTIVVRTGRVFCM